MVNPAGLMGKGFSASSLLPSMSIFTRLDAVISEQHAVGLIKNWLSVPERAVMCVNTRSSQWFMAM